MLRQILGARRADAELPALAAIAAQCVFLPLEAHLKQGRPGDAILVLRQALDLARVIDHPMFEGIALHDLGESSRAAPEHGPSAGCFRRALEQTPHALGDLQRDLRDADAAHASWQLALDIFQELGDSQAGELRTRLRT